MTPPAFRKRIYTARAFRAAILDAFAQLVAFRLAHRRGLVDAAFAERIMLAVTQVNGCRYCQYGHARAALRAGVTRGEVEALAAGDFANVPAAERPALFFAQHYAETGSRPEPEAFQTLVATYGADAAQDILAHIRMITIGNLSGNTFDAFLSRMRGRPAPGSAPWQELGVFVAAPFVMLEGALRRLLRRGETVDPTVLVAEGKP